MSPETLNTLLEEGVVVHESVVESLDRVISELDGTVTPAANRLERLRSARRDIAGDVAAEEEAVVEETPAEEPVVEEQPQEEAPVEEVQPSE